MIAICFCSGEAFPFFPVPMHDVANQAIDLEDLWGTTANEMLDRADKAITMMQRVQLSQRYLIAQLQQSEPSDSGTEFCIGQIKRANGKPSLDESANKIGIWSVGLINTSVFHPKSLPESLRSGMH